MSSILEPLSLECSTPSLIDYYLIVCLLGVYTFTWQDVRGRYRYLSHLPLTCEFVLCELDLKPPLLSQDTVKVFYDELQKRKQKRLKKKREERRKERKREPNPGRLPACS